MVLGERPDSCGESKRKTGLADSRLCAFAAKKERRPSESLLLGKVLCERWRICRWLGAGGMGTVFEAEDRNGSRAAIKVLHRRRRAHLHSREELLRERDLANRVRHHDVVRILDDGETAEGDVFLVMELLEGETLEQLRKNCPLSAREVLRIADRVLDVLVVAHAKGIVHCDIKPSNIFITSRDGGVKVLDFGIASFGPLDAAAMLVLPPSASSAGTPSFMAPEQARGARHRIDCRTDVWALGATMFTLLTGRLVHEEKSADAALIAAATTPSRLIGSVRDDLPMCVADIVDCALSFEQKSRFGRAAEMQFAVSRALERYASDPPPAALPSLRRREPIIAETLPPMPSEHASAATFSPC